MIIVENLFIVQEVKGDGEEEADVFLCSSLLGE